MREIEVKLRVKDPTQLVKTLAEQGCKLSPPISQHDTIYTRGDLSLAGAATEGYVAVRIRRQDDRAEFNLKQQRTSELDNLEYETGVDNPEAVDQMLRILGFVPQIEVQKIRRKSNWREYEICIDEVEGLGSFVELEKLTDDNSDPATVQEELLRELESLGLSRTDQEFKGYDTQLYQLRKGAATPDSAA